jgi:hypothetical protein
MSRAAESTDAVPEPAMVCFAESPWLRRSISNTCQAGCSCKIPLFLVEVVGSAFCGEHSGATVTVGMRAQLAGWLMPTFSFDTADTSCAIRAHQAQGPSVGVIGTGLVGCILQYTVWALSIEPR